MLIFDEDRPSESPLVERVWRCHSEGTGQFHSIAASRCELVVGRFQGQLTVTVLGPETQAAPSGACPVDGEWVGILLKLGTFLPQLPASVLLGTAVDLPPASQNAFWLCNSVWQLPDYENADTFIDRLARHGLLMRDPFVDALLHGHLRDRDARTIQRRFKHTTGLTQSAVHQIERARYATQLLLQGVSILDTIAQAGYFDQPHMTRSLKRFIGQTPAQLLNPDLSEQLPFLYKTEPLDYAILAPSYQ